MKITYVSGVIFVKDIPASRNFYENILGQKVEMDFGANVGYIGGLAIWQVDRANEFIYNEKAPDTLPLGRRNLELYFESEKIQEAWDKVSTQNVKVVHPIKEHPWAQQAFRIYDPDGHIVEVGEPMPATVARLLRDGIAVADVAQKTMMPVEMVQNVSDNIS